jgi:hypothetical protein
LKANRVSRRRDLLRGAVFLVALAAPLDDAALLLALALKLRGANRSLTATTVGVVSAVVL